MKKDITLIVLALVIFLQPPSIAFAFGDNEREILPAKVFTVDDTSYSDKVVTTKEGGFTSSIDERGERSSGAETALRKERDGVYRDNLDLHLTPYVTEQNIPQNLSYRGPAIRPGDNKATPFTSSALDFEFRSVLKDSMGRGMVDVGAALLTQMLLHEAGHYVVADYVEAEGSSLAFFTSRDGQFFLGSSTVTAIDDRSRLPYSMGGEVAADLTFEYALSSYRRNPTLYNKALMLFSGTDLLRYTLYSYFVSDGHDHLDPIAVTKYSGVSKEALISVAVFKTALNASRIHSGNDTVVPYFMVDKESALLMLRVVF